MGGVRTGGGEGGRAGGRSERVPRPEQWGRDGREEEAPETETAAGSPCTALWPCRGRWLTAAAPARGSHAGWGSG